MTTPPPSSTTTTTASLPVIDLSLLDNGDPDIEAKVLQEWNEAFSQFGFCYLSSSSHGLSRQFQRVEVAALEFFTNLTPHEKAVYYLNKGYGHGGYVAPGIERVAASRLVGLDAVSSGSSSSNKPPPADPVESLCVHSEKAEHVPPFLPQDFFSLHQQGDTMDMDMVDVPYKHGLEFKHAVQELWHGLEQLLLRIMTISAKALQLPNANSYFDSAFTPGANFMRMAHYVDDSNNNQDCSNSQQEQQQGQRHHLRYGVHTDYSGFTLLWRNQSNGLQCAADMRQIIDNNNTTTTTDPVQLQPQSWIDVPVLADDPHALVINAGDLIQRWTNDYWVSNLHRVIVAADKSNNNNGNQNDDEKQDTTTITATTAKEPLSIVFFTGPALETKINVLPSPLFASQESKYKEVTAGEHLFQKLTPTSM